MDSQTSRTLFYASGLALLSYSIGHFLGSTMKKRQESQPLPDLQQSLATETAIEEANGGVVISNESRAHERRLSHEAAMSRPGPIIIGVAGASGSGKTSISTLLASRLGPSVPVVAISSDR